MHTLLVTPASDMLEGLSLTRQSLSWASTYASRTATLQCSGDPQLTIWQMNFPIVVSMRRTCRPLDRRVPSAGVYASKPLPFTSHHPLPIYTFEHRVSRDR